MRLLLTSTLAVIAATALQGAAATFPELNVAEGTIMTADGSYSGRDFVVPKDFKLELLYTVPAAEGQWVSTTWDDKGRLIAAGYESDVLNRVTIPLVGSADPVRVERLTTTTVGAAEGLLHAFGSLYINVNRSPTLRAGLYRLTDTNNDDKYDKTEVIRNFTAGGDHGTHALRLSPDGQSIHLLSGNSTRTTVVQSSRVPMIFGEDTLTMRIRTGFMDDSFGDATWEAYTLRLDKDGKNIELYSIGARNPVDFAFNKDGELFTFDSDMEWDMGAPWYRPTNVQHITSGVDFGFRNGSRKHPYWQIDFAGYPVADAGAGSPVGTTFGTKAKFPARYQDAMYIADWSYGLLHAVMMQPNGSSYKGEVVPFVSGRPFPVTSVLVNPRDGSMLVMIGGRATTQVFRVTYTGQESTAPTAPDTKFKADRDARIALERFHGRQDRAAVDAAFARLGDMDHRIRYAARVALEWQPVASWRDRALEEKDPRKLVNAMVALARVSGKDIYSRTPQTPAPDKALQTRMLAALDRIDFAALPYQEKLDILRAYSLAFIRMGDADEATRQRLIAKFDPHFPSMQRELNWEMADMMAYLDAPSAPAKIMTLIRNAPAAAPAYGWQEWQNPQLRQRQDSGGLSAASGNVGVSNLTLAKQEDMVYYAQLLRVVKNGWTTPLREEYLKTFITLGSTRGGNNYAGSISTIRIDALSQMPEAERAALKEVIDTPIPTAGRGGGRGAGAGAAGGAGGAAGGRAGGGAAPAAPAPAAP